MKKIFLSLLGLIVVFTVVSLNLEQESAPISFEKIIYVEINGKIDSGLFVPYSKAWSDSWRFSEADITCNGSMIMNADDYNFGFNQRSDNLWTLLHPKLINGALILYSPYDPTLYGLSGYDDGELRYPIKGSGPNENFLNSQELRDEMCYYLGQFGQQSPVPLATNYGEDSTMPLPDGTISFVYPPRDYMWYRDTDIIKYKVRVRVLVKKNGKEKKRIIEAIAPMVYQTSEGKITGERELLWMDYNEVKPYLKEGYFFNELGKPVTYLKYIEGKVKAGV